MVYRRFRFFLKKIFFDTKIGNKNESKIRGSIEKYATRHLEVNIVSKFCCSMGYYKDFLRRSWL
jgi:hypothetical protein